MTRTAVWVDQSQMRAAVGGVGRAVVGGQVVGRQVIGRQVIGRQVIGRQARAALASPRSSPEAAGEVFAENRINYALELFGACMLIVAFLAIAMFV